MKLRIGQKLSLCILAVGVFNFFSCLHYKDPIELYFLYSGIPLLLTFPFFFIKKEIPRTIISIILLALSVPSIIDNDISNMNGYFLFILSMVISPKRIKTVSVYLFLFISALIYNFNINNVPPSKALTYISGLTFISIFFSYYISSRGITYKVSNDDEINNAVALYVQGYSWDQISTKLGLNITGKSLQRKVKTEYERLGFNNLAQYSHFLGIKGKITIVENN